jgi:hypothetical protein
MLLTPMTTEVRQDGQRGKAARQAGPVGESGLRAGEPRLREMGAVGQAVVGKAGRASGRVKTEGG